MKNKKSLASLRNAYTAAAANDRKAYRAFEIAEEKFINGSQAERKRLGTIADRADVVANNAQRELERAELALLRHLLAAAPAGLAREVIESFRALR